MNSLEENKMKIFPLLFGALFLFFALGGLAIPLIILFLFIYFSKNPDKLAGLKNYFNKANFNSNFKNMNTGNIHNVTPNDLMEKLKGKVKWVVLVVVAALLLPFMIVVVEAGQTGVYSLFGKVKEEELSSGFHFKNPLAKVQKMSIRTEDYTMSNTELEGEKTGADAISALTKEGLTVDLDMTVLYHLEEASASGVYRDVGLNYQEKIIRPAIRSTIREVIAQYDAKVVYSDKRKEASERIADDLRDRLGDRGIVLEDLLLRNVELPPDLRRSIEQKLQAQQEAQKMEFVLEKEEKEKERKIIEAEGQRESQRIINESLTDRFLNYQYIKNLENRKGTIYVPTDGNGLPMFKGIE
ncbi:MAG: prohibitin family protein [Candidatus Moranbacteria bacterium]|nr:prohibitin family protein [Candidatus Moranbacteria bacterium]